MRINMGSRIFVEMNRKVQYNLCCRAVLWPCS